MRPRMSRWPIVIYGAPRSGTTYLVEILNRHPDIAITSETRLFVWAHRALTGITDEFYSLFKEKERFVEYLWREMPDLIREFYAELSDGRPFWGDKNPHYASRNSEGCLDTIMKLFPETRFIHIVRDGRDVVGSILAKRWESFETAHEWWINYTAIGSTFGQSLPIPHYLEFRYEDLVQDDLAMASRILAFLGVDIHPSVEEFCKSQGEQRSPINEPTRDLNADVSASRWEDLLSPSERLRSLDLLEEGLLRYGYETKKSLTQMKRDLRTQVGEEPIGLGGRGEPA